jgi:structural maintenance of chromosome 1
MTQAQQTAVVEELATCIAKLIADLETMQPNMHAVERFESVEEKLREATAELDTAREEAAGLMTAFEKVRRERVAVFQECFSHVSESLGVIYRDLTRSSKHPLGGNAYLTLDNTEEPYLGGIRYTAMPPMKRFRDMEQLSGGEKTMAALSLLFSIHSFRQAPFFVLDGKYL